MCVPPAPALQAAGKRACARAGACAALALHLPLDPELSTPAAPSFPPRAEGDLLGDQVDSVNSAAVMVSQLRRIGKGLGVFEFDKTLQ